MPIEKPEYTAREIKRFEEHIRKAIQFCCPGLLEQAAAYQFAQWKQRYERAIKSEQPQERSASQDT